MEGGKLRHLRDVALLVENVQGDQQGAQTVGVARVPCLHSAPSWSLEATDPPIRNQIAGNNSKEKCFSRLVMDRMKKKRLTSVGEKKMEQLSVGSKDPVFA